MRLTRIFADAPLTCNETLDLPQAASHHLSKVLRMRPDQQIQVFNGRGGYYSALITAIGKRSVTIVPLEFFAEQRESSLEITLAQGISRGQHMDYTVQKAVELGVTKIVPLVSEFSNVHLDRDRAENKLAHWRSIIIHACEQCGRTRVPEISSPMPFMDWVGGVSHGVKIILAPLAGNTLKEITDMKPAVTLLSGPEGGFSEDEIANAVAAGYRPVALGPRVLRTETAALAALCAIQVLWGDLG